jgi:PTH1 family peptidyl-tRNA hydrolase
MSDTGCMIVGLGNPGTKYEDTRHNVGFWAIESYASKQGLSISLNKWKGDYCRDRVAGIPLILLKPQTFMNRSGECAGRFQDFFKITPDRILVIHDDLDLEPGRIKVVSRGGAGGHNGIRSIISHLGGQDFARIKIGIGRPHTANGGAYVPVENFVLAPFAPDERQCLLDRMPLVLEAIDLFIENGVAVTMNTINGKS